MLADEPTGNLDSAATTDVLRLFEQLHVNGQTLVIVTHDERIAATADRLISMRDGAFVDETRLTGGTARPLSAITGPRGMIAVGRVSARLAAGDRRHPTPPGPVAAAGRDDRDDNRDADAGVGAAPREPEPVRAHAGRDERARTSWPRTAPRRVEPPIAQPVRPAASTPRRSRRRPARSRSLSRASPPAGSTSPSTPRAATTRPAAVDQPLLTAGHWVSSGGAVIEQGLADTLGVHVGDTISLGGHTLPRRGDRAHDGPAVLPGVLAGPGVGDAFTMRSASPTTSEPLGYMLDIKWRSGRPTARPRRAGVRRSLPAGQRARRPSSPWHAIRAADYRVIELDQKVLLIGSLAAGDARDRQHRRGRRRAAWPSRRDGSGC